MKSYQELTSDVNSDKKITDDRIENTWRGLFDPIYDIERLEISIDAFKELHSRGELDTSLIILESIKDDINTAKEKILSTYKPTFENYMKAYKENRLADK